MDSKFIPAQVEEPIYSFWEKNGYFTAKVDKTKKPFSIILPPPNANGNLHAGHVMMVYEDILIRFNKLSGYETFWVLGLDHAGIETQYVFEKELRKQGKSRLDYDRETLYKMIWEFVEKSRGNIKGQFRKLGFALDWTKEKYTLDPDIVKIVYTTFEKLFNEGLVYRSERLVNFCTRDGTSFSDLEVVDKEVDGLLYHIKFPVKEGGYITIATTRPETMLGDVGVMVNPKDKRYKNLIGKTVILPITNREVPIIADEYVDMKFGTGAVKITPAHDPNDFEIAKKNNLTFPPVIGFNGKMQNTGIVDGMKVLAAREEVLKRLKELNLFEKETPHKMVVKTCYKCGNILEPLPLEQWYIKVKPLADNAKKLVNEDKIKVYPKKFKKRTIEILDNFIDWNISRQNVWGIRIPAYKCESQQKWFVSVNPPEKCEICGKNDAVQDPDIFDTWFSSSQWPFATLQALGQDYFEYFYPTSVMETGYDILRAWVARMIMIGYETTGKVPFENILLHGIVRDKQGQKMSKSKGNVVNPLDMVERYGADALRAAMVYGTSEGNDVLFMEDKIRGMRNFANKVWNIGRFIYMNQSNKESRKSTDKENESVENMLKEFNEEKKKYTQYMKKYQFSNALGLTYEFLWHRFADIYIEELKDGLLNGNIRVLDALKEVYFANLKMLHPFMPFLTEAVWQVFYGEKASILDEKF